jgi:folate-dependent phosphoribosylglycinamide formyltransferase PurN
MEEGPRFRSVAILTGASHLAGAAVSRYVAALGREHVTVIEERPATAGKLARFLARRSRSRGMASAVDAVLGRAVQQLAGGRLAGQHEAALEPDHVVESVNDPVIAAWLSARQVDLVILNLCAVVQAEQLVRFGVPVINVHPGINPRYRGGGVTWALSEGAFDLVGSTLHAAVDKADAGTTLAIALVKPFDRRKGVEQILWEVHLKGVDLAIAYVRGEALPPLPEWLSALESRFYPYPGLSVWFRACRRLRKGRAG